MSPQRRALAASLACLSLALATAGCSPSRHGTPWSNVREVTPPFLAHAAAADPSLAIERDGRIALTWVTRDSLGADAWLSVSSDSGSNWSTPVRLEPRPGMVSSYAESRPVVAWGRDGMLVAAWAAARDASHRADDVAVRVSSDGGRTWGEPQLVNDDHRDASSTYHGFIALDVLPDGRPIVAWIDGRFSAAPGEEPAVADLFAATTSDGGETWSDNSYVAEGVCPCCRVSLRADRRSGGPIEVAVAFRGAVDDLRDPRLAMSRDGGTTFTYDTLMSADRWKLAGCPSIGPTLTFTQGGGVYAWFTGAGDTLEGAEGGPAPGAYLVPWRSGLGPNGAKRSLADSLRDATRPMLAALGRGTLVAAIGGAVGGPERKVLAVRRLEVDGALTPWLYLGSGVRSAAVAGQGASSAWAAWAEKSTDLTRVRVARLSVR